MQCIGTFGYYWRSEAAYALHTSRHNCAGTSHMDSPKRQAEGKNHVRSVSPRHARQACARFAPRFFTMTEATMATVSSPTMTPSEA